MAASPTRSGITHRRHHRPPVASPTHAGGSHGAAPGGRNCGCGDPFVEMQRIPGEGPAAWMVFYAVRFSGVNSSMSLVKGEKALGESSPRGNSAMWPWGWGITGGFFLDSSKKKKDLHKCVVKGNLIFALSPKPGAIFFSFWWQWNFKGSISEQAGLHLTIQAEFPAFPITAPASRLYL